MAASRRHPHSTDGISFRSQPQHPFSTVSTLRCRSEALRKWQLSGVSRTSIGDVRHCAIFVGCWGQSSNGGCPSEGLSRPRKRRAGPMLWAQRAVICPGPRRHEGAAITSWIE